MTNEGQEAIFCRLRLTHAHDPGDDKVTWISYHHFQRDDIFKGNKGPLLIKDKPLTPIMRWNLLVHNQQVIEEEVKIGTNRGKLYVTAWSNIVIEARLTGYSGNTQDDV